MAQANTVEQLRVRQASEPERQLAYQLRYKVFTIELGDTRYANHAMKEFVDVDDQHDYPTVVGIVDGNVVGTVRLKALAKREFIGARSFDFPLLARHIGMDEELLVGSVACLDRGCVDNEWRGKGVFEAMYSYAEQLAVEESQRVLVIAVMESKRSVTRYYQRQLVHCDS